MIECFFRMGRELTDPSLNSIGSFVKRGLLLITKVVASLGKAILLIFILGISFPTLTSLPSSEVACLSPLEVGTFFLGGSFFLTIFLATFFFLTCFFFLACALSFPDFFFLALTSSSSSLTSSSVLSSSLNIGKFC